MSFTRFARSLLVVLSLGLGWILATTSVNHHSYTDDLFSKSPQIAPETKSR